jgi:hypothetical protein
LITTKQVASELAASVLHVANLDRARGEVRAPTGVMADATHLVSADSRADEPLPSFVVIAGTRVSCPASRGIRDSRGGSLLFPNRSGSTSMRRRRWWSCSRASGILPAALPVGMISASS